MPKFGVLALLAILIPALAALHCTSSSDKDCQRQKYLDALNGIREKYALVAQVANMNELDYDKELEKQAAKFSDCTDRHLMSDQVLGQNIHYIYSKDHILNDYLNFVVNHRNDSEGMKKMFGFEDLLVGVLFPTVSRVSCVPFKKSCSSSRIPKFYNVTELKTIRLRGVCLFGPIPNKHVIKYGPPASQCEVPQHGRLLCLPKERFDENVVQSTATEKVVANKDEPIVMKRKKVWLPLPEEIKDN